MCRFLVSDHFIFYADAEQCKYGKNRVEADAKRLQAKEDEMMKKKQDIRNHLTQLKKEKRDLRNAVEAATGKRDGYKCSMVKCLADSKLSSLHQANVPRPPCPSD